MRLARADCDPELGTRLVALSTATFTCKRDWNTHRLLRAIDHNTLLSRLDATECGDPRDCFRAPKELRSAYAEMPELVARAEDLLAGCSMVLPEPPEGACTTTRTPTRKVKTGTRRWCGRCVRRVWPTAIRTTTTRCWSEWNTRLA